MTYESWIRKALDQAGTLHPGLAESSTKGAIYFVGCTINIVASAQAGTELPAVPFATGTKSPSMPATERSLETPGTHRAE